MEIKPNEKLAFEAAMLETQNAKKAWNKLLQLEEFGNLGQNIYRILPTIYKNLENSRDIPMYERLKGAYRYNWSKNSKLFFEVLPILRQLNDSKINYRVLKGAAINISHNSLGLRTMGDFDLLVGKSSMIQTIEIIKKNGFKQKYDTNCVNTRKSIVDSELCFISESNIEIDVHIDKLSYPQAIFKRMLKEDPRVVSFLNTLIPIPSNELAFLHAVLHGSQKVAVTDQIQGLIDCAHLIKKSNLKTIITLSKKLGALSISIQFLDFLKNSLNVQLYYGRNSKINFFNKLLAKWLGIKNVFEQDFYILTALRTRKIKQSSLRKVLFLFNGKKLPYFFWLLFGQFRIIEFYYCKFFNGFLSSPKNSLKPNIFIKVFSNSEKSVIEASNSVKFSYDWRFRARVVADEKINLIQFFSADFRTWNWIVFLNGKLIGSTPKNTEGVYSVYITSNLEVLEFSFRSPLHACSICAHSLSDLKMICLVQ